METRSEFLDYISTILWTAFITAALTWLYVKYDPSPLRQHLDQCYCPPTSPAK